MKNKEITDYSYILYPASRIASADICELGKKRHLTQALIEIDVTKAREMIREYKKAPQKTIIYRLAY